MFRIERDNSALIHQLRGLLSSQISPSVAPTSATGVVETGVAVQLGDVSASVNASNQLLIQLTDGATWTASGFSETYAGAAASVAYYQNVNVEAGVVMSGNMGSAVGQGCQLTFSDSSTQTGTYVVTVQKAMLGLWSITVEKL